MNFSSKIYFLSSGTDSSEFSLYSEMTINMIAKYDPWKELQWETDECFHLNELTFTLVSWGSPKRRSDGNNFVLVKDATFADSMSRILLDRQPKKILEFGIYQGASMVLLDQLYRPEILIGIDERVNVDALERYIESGRAYSKIFTGYGVLQDNAAAIHQLLDESLACGYLDLVIDDCSHLYLQSKRSFEISFPRLSRGGIYIIEDWGWAHWSGEFQEKVFFEGLPLSQLVFELLMIQSTRPDWIERIEVDFHHVAIFRGPGIIDRNSFSIDSAYRSNQAINISKR